MVKMDQQAVPVAEGESTARERVENELEELKEKIVKLSAFLFGKKILDANLSAAMRYAKQDQLKAMQEYALQLQRQLVIWDKTDEEIAVKCW